jgi:hypothetical protein
MTRNKNENQPQTKCKEAINFDQGTDLNETSLSNCLDHYSKIAGGCTIGMDTEKVPEHQVNDISHCLMGEPSYTATEIKESNVQQGKDITHVCQSGCFNTVNVHQFPWELKELLLKILIRQAGRSV